MTKALATSPDAGVGPSIAASAAEIGRPSLGERSLLSEGAVVRADGGAVAIGTGSAVIENCVVIGAPGMPVAVGRPDDLRASLPRLRDRR